MAQVLSHLGSGAEIAHAGYRAALDGTPAPEQEFNQGVWDRWNARSPRTRRRSSSSTTLRSSARSRR